MWAAERTADPDAAMRSNSRLANSVKLLAVPFWVSETRELQTATSDELSKLDHLLCLEAPDEKEDEPSLPCHISLSVGALRWSSCSTLPILDTE